MLAGFEDTLGLTQMPHIKVYGLTGLKRLKERDPTFSFKVERFQEDDVVKRLWIKHAIAVRAEDFYSKVHEVYKSPKMIRATFVHYNTLEEALRLLKALDKMKLHA